jgi:hypothetical protein
MTIVYIFCFLLAIVAYRRGQLIVKNQFDHLGVRYKGVISPKPIQHYRSGKDAVAVGRFTQICGVIFAVVTVVDVVQGTAYFIYAFILSTLLYNTVVRYFYPVHAYHIQNDGRLTGVAHEVDEK